VTQLLLTAKNVNWCTRARWR